MNTYRAVVVDDEPLARQRLRTLLAAHPAILVVGEAGDGDDAIRQVEVLQPDVLFLDVELPGRNGLDVVRALATHPLVVFTTAFDRYAVTAFELAAVDYLLKPFGPERLASAVQRVLEQLQDGSASASVADRATEALSSDGRDQPITRFFVRDRGKLVPIAVRDVERLEADDDYVRVHAKGRMHLVYLTLNDFERRLDPERFLRIHRGHIVNLDFVRHLVPQDGGRLYVELQDGTRIQASRARARELRQLTL